MSVQQIFTDKLILPIVVGLLVAILPLLVPKGKFKRLWHRWVAALLLSIVAAASVYFIYPRNTTGADDVVAGTIVDEGTAASIQGARISVVGRSETCISESNGNFRLHLDVTTAPEIVQLRIEKIGYTTYEVSARPPAHDLQVQLRRMK